jgi:putrescine transport system substrate-binding protein
MFRTFARALILATAFLTLPAIAQERVVNVYNWSDYIDPDVLAAFTKETGIKVKYDTFDSNEMVETKLLAGKSGYDVVVPTANFLERQIKAGVFQKLDKSKLKNLGHVWPEIAERLGVYDPGNVHAVNYMWGTTGIGYNVDKVKAALGTDDKPNWDALFDPAKAAKLKDCGIYMLDSRPTSCPRYSPISGSIPTAPIPPISRRRRRF